MAAAADKTKKNVEKDKAGTPRSPILITALVAVLAAAAAGGGVWFFTQSTQEEKTSQAPKKKSATPAPAQYFALEPAFVVNLNGPIDGPRYLQVEVQLVTRDPAALEAIKTHAPALRARLLMLFSQVGPAQIADIAGKKKLQADSLAEVQKVLKAETGSNGADDLLFTSFVTQ